MVARRTSVAGNAAWALCAAIGLFPLVLGLAQKFHLGTVTNAFERDRTGNTLILLGVVLAVAAAGWSRFRRDPLWATLTVATPAVVIGGLNLMLGDSLLPHLAALVSVPARVAGIIGGLVSHRGRRGV